jgi:hypothetical protein
MSSSSDWTGGTLLPSLANSSLSLDSSSGSLAGWAWPVEALRDSEDQELTSGPDKNQGRRVRAPDPTTSMFTGQDRKEKIFTLFIVGKSMQNNQKRLIISR